MILWIKKENYDRLTDMNINQYSKSRKNDKSGQKQQQKNYTDWGMQIQQLRACKSEMLSVLLCKFNLQLAL